MNTSNLAPKKVAAQNHSHTRNNNNCLSNDSSGHLTHLLLVLRTNPDQAKKTYCLVNPRMMVLKPMVLRLVAPKNGA